MAYADVEIDSCSGFGHDKSLEIRPYANLPAAERPVLFYAGDGVSDLSAAKETDLLFAKAGKRRPISCPFDVGFRMLMNDLLQSWSPTVRLKTCLLPRSTTSTRFSTTSRPLWQERSTSRMQPRGESKSRVL